MKGLSDEVITCEHRHSGKLQKYLAPFFEGFTRPTSKILIWIVIAMQAVGRIHSVRCLYTDFLADLDLVSLNTLYHVLSYAKRPVKRAFTRVIVRLILGVVPESLRDCPVFLCVDDTLIPKYGKKFEGVGVLFDHADRH